MGKVFFEPHYFRFKPKNNSHSHVKRFSIKIEPEPAGFSEQLDIEDNHNLFCWFNDENENLKIIANSVIEADDYNPFNFLVHPTEYLTIPFKYKKKTNQLLKPSLYNVSLPDEMIDFKNNILFSAGNQSIDFLILLTKEINKTWNLKSREKGEPLNPVVTFKQKEGSCRDLAWMLIHILRTSGIASRFVSGYFYLEAEDANFELHAWVEAYLPGAGWIGLDPSHGILTGNYHIPVASSAFYENTMPVSGNIRGKFKSTLKNELSISITS